MAVTDYGEPLVELDMPEPELRPGHALLEVLACGVCFSDVKTSRGLMPFSEELELPHVPGHEISARVIATDPQGAIEPGTHVVVHHYTPCGRCARCRAGDENQCENLVAWTGFTHDGGFAERMVAPLDRLFEVPEGVDPLYAGPLTCALGTAYRSIVTRGEVSAGMDVAVIGIGGVGIHTLQIARSAGARAVGLDNSERALEVAGELGLDAMRADEEGVEERALAATDAGSFDLVIDNVGAEPTLARAVRLVRPGGRIVGVGYRADTELRVPTPTFALGELELMGSRYVSRDALARAIHLVADGEVKLIVDRVFPLAEVNDAYETLENGGLAGRLVLDVAGIGPGAG
ncbi:MAG: alcohol dehydrogenase catalytic domain-containing protein [Solirubrobacterales bacterium]